MKRIVSIILVIGLLVSLSSCLFAFPQPARPLTPAEIPQNKSAVKPIEPAWTPPSIEKGATTLPSIADVVAKVYPSVVAISTEVSTQSFFYGPQKQSGAGSGWIIDKDGIIVTNNHVVEGASKVSIELYDGRIFEVDTSKVHRDPVTDLAVIKIEASNLPAAELGDSSKLRVGDWVVAIGNPLGQGLRAKEGTISGLKVSLPVDEGQTLDDLIETSAAINPGNSGGPLVNMQGQVAGITSAKISGVGVEGMGYAIGIKTAVPIITQLISNGYVTRPYLGVTLATVTPYLATVYRLPVDKGAAIAYVAPDSPADKAGLKTNDIVVRFQNKDVASTGDLLQTLHNSKIGEEVTITFVRGKETRTAFARLIESPPPGR
jgi:serine protease Do